MQLPESNRPPLLRVLAVTLSIALLAAAFGSEPGFAHGDVTPQAVGMTVKRSSDDLNKALATAMFELRESGELGKIFQKHGVGWTPLDAASGASALPAAVKP